MNKPMAAMATISFIIDEFGAGRLLIEEVERNSVKFFDIYAKGE